MSVREELDPRLPMIPTPIPTRRSWPSVSYAGLPQNILDLYDSEWTRLKSAT